MDQSGSAITQPGAEPKPKQERSESRAMEWLVDALWTLPLRTTPIVQSKHREEHGLALIELSLQLRHVVRQSESITFTDKDHATRMIALDLDLSRITRRHYAALGTGADQGGEEQIWLPITTQSRQDLAPTEIKDAFGALLPRMTLDESVAAFAAGLIRLFRMLLDSSPGANQPASDPQRSSDIFRMKHELHRSRWLIEAAIYHVINFGPTNGYGLVDYALRSEDSSSHNEAESIRYKAETGLRALAASGSSSFASFTELVAMAAMEYPIAVLIPRNPQHALIQYETPLAPIGRHLGEYKRGNSQVLSPTRSFTAAISTSAPRTVRSHHVGVGVNEQIRVRRFLLSTNADERAVRRLIDDMRGVAERYSDLRGVGEKILENELQSIAERLSIIISRRLRDFAEYRLYLQGESVKVTAPEPSLNRPADEVLDDFISGRQTPLSSLAEFAMAYQSGHYTHLAPSLTPVRLTNLAERISDLELSRSIVPDNDSRENWGHAHWRVGSASRDESPNSEPVDVQIFLELVDDPPSLSQSVTRMLFALLATVFAAFMIGFSDPLWFLPTVHHVPISWERDAVVTALLLVPGILLSRLDIPSTNSILGQIRLQSRLVAYAAASITTGLAIYVATADVLHFSIPVLAVFGLVLLIALNLLSTYFTRRGAYDTAARHRFVPEWVRAEASKQLSARFNPRPFEFTVRGGRGGVRT